MPAAQARPRPESDEVRLLAERAEALERKGQAGEAVGALVDLAAVYLRRGVPIRAVATLRQALRLQPDEPGLRLAYGDVLARLRMVQEAAREYNEACRLLRQAGRTSALLEAVGRLVHLNPDNTSAALTYAELLSRSGQGRRAASAFRDLAARLLEKGAIEAWEAVSERLYAHDPDDTTAAHDLALHYVRSGRPALAVEKLLQCHLADPSDLELIELVVEVFSKLGQVARARQVASELAARYRSAGLGEESDRLRRRAEAFSSGATSPRLETEQPAEERVIELVAGKPPTPLQPVPAAEPGFDPTDAPTLLSPVVGKGAAAPALAAPGPAPGPPPTPRPSAPTPAQHAAGAAAAEPPAGASPQRTPPRRRREFDDSEGFPVPEDTVPHEARSQDPAPPARRSSGPRPASRPLRTTGGYPSAAAGRGESPASGAPAGQRLPGQGRSSSPAPDGPQPPLAPGGRPSSTLRRTHRGTMAPSVGAEQPKVEVPLAPTSTESAHSWLLDEEVEFSELPDRTVFAPLEHVGPAGRSVPSATAGPKTRDTRPAGSVASGRSPPQSGPGQVAATGPAASQGSPSASGQVRDTRPSTSPFDQQAGERRTAAQLVRRRTSNLPRPRLSRNTAGELPATGRPLEGDLETLDFFIERGFYESAVAMVSELERRFPGHDAIGARRARIEALRSK